MREEILDLRVCLNLQNGVQRRCHQKDQRRHAKLHAPQNHIRYIAFLRLQRQFH